MNMSQFCMQSSLSWPCSDKARSIHCNMLPDFPCCRCPATSMPGRSWQAAVPRSGQVRGGSGLAIVLLDGDRDGPGLGRGNALPRTGVGEGNCGRSLPDSLEGEGVGAATGPQTVGGGGTDTFTFKAVGKGTTTISLAYARPWESVPPAQTRTITVTVN